MKQLKETGDFSDFDQMYEAWRAATGSNATFSEWAHIRALEGLRKGQQHATLGCNLAPDRDWFSHGREEFEQIIRLCPISPEEAVCDYGCGSLRIGKHFIERQSAGNYVGIDPNIGLIELGASKLSALIARKSPVLGAPQDTVEKAISAKAKITFSMSVMRHVHPDEHDRFFSTLLDISQHPGAFLLLDAHVADEPTRFARSGWAWPKDYYSRRLSELRLSKCEPERDSEDVRARGTRRHIFLFQRPL